MASMQEALCKLFGHKMPSGYRGDRPYLRCTPQAVDGMGIHHVNLRGECPRCHELVTFAYAHIPTPKDWDWYARRRRS